METAMEDPPSSIIPHLPKEKSSGNVIYFCVDIGEPNDNYKAEVRVDLVTNDLSEYSAIWSRKDPENRATWRQVSRYLQFKTEAEVEAEWLKFLSDPKLYLGYY